MFCCPASPSPSPSHHSPLRGWRALLLVHSALLRSAPAGLPFRRAAVSNAFAARLDLGAFGPSLFSTCLAPFSSRCCLERVRDAIGSWSVQPFFVQHLLGALFVTLLSSTRSRRGLVFVRFVSLLLPVFRRGLPCTHPALRPPGPGSAPLSAPPSFVLPLLRSSPASFSRPWLFSFLAAPRTRLRSPLPLDWICPSECCRILRPLLGHAPRSGLPVAGSARPCALRFLAPPHTRRAPAGSYSFFALPAVAPCALRHWSVCPMLAAPLRYRAPFRRAPGPHPAGSPWEPPSLAVSPRRPLSSPPAHHNTLRVPVALPSAARYVHATSYNL